MQTPSRGFFIRALFLTLYAALAQVCPAAAATPQLPQQTVNTAFVAPTGQTISVADGGDLQGALNSAQPGDVIVLQAGATFTGNFTLPNKSGSGWITIESSALSSLPASGTRVSPSNASLMPKIVTPNSQPALATVASAHNYRIVGVEFGLASGNAQTYDLVDFGDPSSAQSSTYQVPQNLILDRVYIHGTSSANVRRGVGLNSASSAVIDSYISDIHEAGADNQAIAGWNGPGPYKIDNNYLEAAGENILFGGADPSIPNLVPSDITITHNYFTKQTSWQGSSWQIKNLLELKNAQRVLIDGNVLEHNWAAAQNGFSILFTVRNQDGTAPWSVVQDVTFTHNVVQHLAQAINILGKDDIQSSQQEQRILIENNLFYDVGGSWGDGRLFQVLNDAIDVTIDHNTALSNNGNSFIDADEAPSTGFVFQNNVAENGQYGLIGSGAAVGTGTLTAFFPGAVFTSNAIIGGTCGCYPAGNFFPANDAAVPFNNAGAGDYSLAASSPYRNAGTGGEDLGVDWSALTSMTAGVLNGNGGSGSGDGGGVGTGDGGGAGNGGGAAGSGGTGGGTPTMSLDTPGAGTVVAPFAVAGWAIDRGAGSGPGVDAVDVYAYPNPGSGEAPILLGVAAYGGTRNDVGAIFGSQFASSGFDLPVTNLAPGSYQIVAFAHSTVSQTFNDVRTVTVTVGASLQVAIDTPGAGVVSEPFTVAGWAVDRAASSGPGIDAVQVYAYPVAGGAATFLGTADYGGARPDVGALLGSQFSAVGYGLHVRGLPAGMYQVAVFAHSTVTGTFGPAQTRLVTVQSTPMMTVDLPVAGPVGRQVTVAGWAIDPAAASGSGVDAVQAWAYPASGGAPIFLGTATLGGTRPDVAAYYGAGFAAPGYQLVAQLPAAGAYQLVVYAHSTVSGTFNDVRTVNIVAQ